MPRYLLHWHRTPEQHRGAHLHSIRLAECTLFQPKNGSCAQGLPASECAVFLDQHILPSLRCLHEGHNFKPTWTLWLEIGDALLLGQTWTEQPDARIQMRAP